MGRGYLDANILRLLATGDVEQLDTRCFAFHDA
jgi:hypothetical protein